MKNHPIYKRYLVSKEGLVKNQVTGRVLKQRETEQGYMEVTVWCDEQKKYVLRKVHRLVAQTYIDNPEHKREVNHLDGNKKNNCVDNLEWCTSKENKDHAWENGYYTSIGENHHAAYFTEELVRNICERIQEGYRNIDIADMYGIHRERVSDIRIGRRWKHISKDYNLSVKRQNRKSPETVIEVAMLLEKGYSVNYIHQKTGVKPYDINKIKRRDLFYELTKDFKF